MASRVFVHHIEDGGGAKRVPRQPDIRSAKQIRFSQSPSFTTKGTKFCVVRLYSRYSPTLDNLSDGFDNLQAGQGQYDEGRQPQPPPEQIGIQAGMSGHE